MPEAATAEPPEDEDLVVSLTDVDVTGEKPAVDQPPKPPPVPGPSAAPAAEPSPAQTGLADLERQIESERQARQRAQQDNQRLARERDQAIAFAQEAERRGVSAYELYADNQIQGIQDQMDALEGQHEGAQNEGNFKLVAEINKKLGRLGGQLAVLEDKKAAYAQHRERMKQAPAPQRQQQQPQRQAPTDPIERAIDGRTEQTKSFLRKHPELIRSDGSLKRAAIEAHEKALDEGHAVDTPAYFAHIERTLEGTIKRAVDETTTTLVSLPGYAAPVARGPAPGTTGMVAANGTFVMTPKMRRLAQEQGVTPQEWATNYVRLLKEGRITPIT